MKNNGLLLLTQLVALIIKKLYQKGIFDKSDLDDIKAMSEKNK